MREKTKIIIKIKKLGRTLKESLDNEKYNVNLGIKKKNPLASKEKDLMKSFLVVKAEMIDLKEVSNVMK